jgi:DNA-binding IclR family transcriptional regulator
MNGKEFANKWTKILSISGPYLDAFRAELEEIQHLAFADGRDSVDVERRPRLTPQEWWARQRG